MVRREDFDAAIAAIKQAATDATNRVNARIDEVVNQHANDVVLTDADLTSLHETADALNQIVPAPAPPAPDQPPAG